MVLFMRMSKETVGQITHAALSLSGDSRVLGLDWGGKKVGLAISDPLGLTAQGLPTLVRRNKQEDFNFLKMLARKHRISLIILGNPLNMNGVEGTQAEKIRSLAKELEHQLNIEVRLWDERLTSVEANRVLQEAGIAPTRRRQSVDRMAAVLLLQNFLDAQPRPPLTSPGEEV